MGLRDRETSKAQQDGDSQKQSKRYGIADALALLRDLPVDANPELVMRVVRKTLESNHVQVEDLIVEAKMRAAQIEQTITNERATIAELEREIASRNGVVVKLGQELAEMRQASDRLAGGEWDRPSVMTLQDGDIESIPTPGPIPRPKPALADLARLAD